MKQDDTQAPSLREAGAGGSIPLTPTNIINGLQWALEPTPLAKTLQGGI